jgi:hypothetical protein
MIGFMLKFKKEAAVVVHFADREVLQVVHLPNEKPYIAGQHLLGDFSSMFSSRANVIT